MHGLDSSHDAPLCGQPTFAQRIASMEAEMPGDLSYGADQTIADMLTCIREQQAALQAASHALRSYQYGNGAPDLAESTADSVDATTARWRIE